MPWFFLNHQNMLMFFLAELTLKSQQICQPGCRKIGRNKFDAFVFSLRVFRVLGVPKKLLFSQKHDLQSLSAYYTCVLCQHCAYVFTLTRALWQRFYRSHNMTAATHKSRGSKVWSPFSFYFYLLSQPPSLLHSLGSLSISFSLCLSLNQGWSWDGVFKNSSGPGHVWRQLLFNQGELVPLPYIFTKYTNMRD